MRARTKIGAGLGLLALMIGSEAFAAGGTAYSHYTSLTNCQVLRSSQQEKEPEIDYFESLCPGREGFNVALEGGDARSWIGLVAASEDYEDRVSFYGPLMGTNFGQFPNVEGEKLEWRYKGNELVALIVRMSGHADGENTSRNGLVVLRVNKKSLADTCAIGKTTDNEQARAIADDLSKVCGK